MSNRQQRRHGQREQREAPRFVVTPRDQGGHHVIEGKGHEYQVTPERVARMDPMADLKPGEHVWVMVTTFRVHPPIQPDQLMDTENLIAVGGPGCYVCEQDWTEEVGALPCPGDPGAT